ncbi:MAG: isoaspartyl peptidase/L-asparaginase family protein [Nitrospira sp.]|nr:isoaspartyl peptidase/L-asparaginase family protein [Nitrospira sp.]
MLVHGGAGFRRMTGRQGENLRAALQVGWHLLDRGASALAAVEEAIRALERSGLFNAGRGARLQLDGVRRMDAALMEGEHLQAGAVASIEGIAHPITAARLVMEKTAHVLLVGPMATMFARHFNLERQRASQPRRRPPYGTMLEQARRASTCHGTVGAVALDRLGTVAAGASTGGIACMLPGRVGDTPLIGCGVYADNRAGAVSMTGIGEGIMRTVMAKSICDRLERGEAPKAAVRNVLKTLATKVGGVAGTLALAPDGRFAIAHTTSYMAAGWWNGKGEPIIKDCFHETMTR